MGRPSALSLLLLAACALLPSAPLTSAAREGASTRPQDLRTSEATAAQGLSAESARQFLSALATRRGNGFRGSLRGRALEQFVPEAVANVYTASCNRTQGTVTCAFCNPDPVPLQNVRLFYYFPNGTGPVPFDGTSRKGVEANGFLKGYFTTGSCTKFSYNSARNLVPKYYYRLLCASDYNPYLTPIGRCWATKQTGSLKLNLTDPFNTDDITCDVSCRFVNLGPAKPANMPFPNPTPENSPLFNLFGGLKYNQTSNLLSLGYKIGYGESNLFGFSYVYDAGTPPSPSAPVLSRAPARGLSGPSNALPCTKTGNKYACQFCNSDTIALQNVDLEISGTFDGKDRKNINKDGDLPGLVNTGDCVNFSFTSSSALDFFYDDANKCSNRGSYMGWIAHSLNANLDDDTLAVVRCFAATQIFDPSGGARLSCQIKCRPYNYYKDITNPIFPCDQDQLNPNQVDIPNTNGNSVTIFDTTGKLTVVGVSSSDAPKCRLNKKFGFGESDQFSYTYNYADGLS